MPETTDNNNNNNGNNAASLERQRKRPRSIVKRTFGAVVQDPETSKFSMLVRSAGSGNRCKSIQLSLSEPAADEECAIGLVPISEFRLSFMPPDATSLSVTEGQQALTKASLPCGHGFNALALLYHFAKNSMTCPYCRAGHAKILMSEQSIPLAVREHFTKHLADIRAEENRERSEQDAVEATRVMEQEVRRSNGFLPLTRVVLLLYAYNSVDGSGADPMLVLELPLTSSLSMGTLVFASFGYSVAQLNLNLLRLPTRPTGFEIAIGLQSLYHGNLPLFRTVRFPATGAEQQVVFARDLPAGEPMAVHVSTMAGVEGLSVFCRLTWIVSAPTFSHMLVEAARAQAVDAGMIMAAV